MRIALDLTESLHIALTALRANKARGVLTTLGIIIGIVAVILTMTAAHGLQTSFRESFSSVGSDVIYVSRYPWVMMNDFFLYRNRRHLSLRDAAELDRRLGGAAIVNPTMSGQQDIKCGAETMEGVTIIGTTEKQILVASAQPQAGRFINDFDVTSKRNVCVIGTDVADGLFGSSSPVNQEMKIGRASFRVVGVMEKQGGNFLGGPNFDRQIFVPISTYAKAFGGDRGFENVDLAVKAPSQEAMGDLEFAVIGEMRKIRQLRPAEPDDFSINKLDTLMGTFNNMMGVVLLVGLLVTSISLFVGGVGVMNVMFVSVTERTREIGIRKAIGAKPHSILCQFLFEAVAICLAGGMIGIAIASGLTAVINATLMPASVSLPILGTAVAVAVAVGVVAGFVPAYRGARLRPIDALRYE
jgi:putative ABC transport system permease protein